ncbi:Alternative oxidase, mitochondrial [Wickerhamomyces ciferrii]|uniref:Alternative oxidase n=1 Tax=Wickerhamomyces ciferrii (strain ATCC 14091 / BCRC 22168 / CBS 111 / JCM 3599 / NBRC 0793 / NRRL Y-1031 F-60-10) TaxID=1206466 RepID=K0KMT9_WICCF|nr:Alternative oxidase, mitochondrial [Wickerhamomyces ciferrii]CCH46595.1 Alternative oxidase, mitochondrial [Wickerhamomyces ciferrii]
MLKLELRSNYNPALVGLRCFTRSISTSKPRPSVIFPNQPASVPKQKNKLDISTKLVVNPPPNPNDDGYISHPTFPHPKFTGEDCEKVHYVHRKPITVGDKIANGGMRFCRYMFDFVTGYKKPKDVNGKLQTWEGTRYEMTEEKWLTRVIFLESIAGVPGMVAAFVRHLHSIRLLKRDKAWIETLLDEAYNERMHLLTFMKLGNPSWFTRLIIYVGQGVFCNLFFLIYLIRPRYCHRFVGYLEEEAVSTYTHLIKDLDAKRLPRFDNVKLPEIAWVYWTSLDENSTFRDLVLRVRADESKHREVNHTLANLKQRKDRNPFALKIDGVPLEDQPDEYSLKTKHPEGWARDELKL